MNVVEVAKKVICGPDGSCVLTAGHPGAPTTCVPVRAGMMAILRPQR